MRRIMVVMLFGLVCGSLLAPRVSQAEPNAPEKRGCCSHHKGVCGCSNGTTQCCDGTASPTCTC